MKTNNGWYNAWKESFLYRKQYCTSARDPFYKLAAKYLPDDRDAIVVDIGAGEGGFAEALKLERKYLNLFLLDGNPITVDNLRRRFKNAVFYRAPGVLPFSNNAIRFVHCSHILEHLYPGELYSFLEEVNRVLSENGILVISAPMLSSSFYNDLSHIKPYNPEIFLKYLHGQVKNPSSQIIANNYSILECVYRYRLLELDDGWGSSLKVVDFAIQLVKKLLGKISIKRFMKRGYTLVLRKEKCD